MKISAVTIIFFTSAITSSYAKKNGDGSFSAPCGSEGDEKCMKPYKCVPWYNGQPFGCGSGPGGNGAVCEKNKDCRTGYCGAESGTCTFCGTDEDCGKKKYCSVYYGDANRRVCVTGKPGDYCDDDADCKGEGTCVSSRCFKAKKSPKSPKSGSRRNPSPT